MRWSPWSRPRRQGEAQRLIDALSMEAWNYYHDYGEFPPGDGIGTAGLVRALQEKSSSGEPYMTFVPEMLTTGGDLRNPVAPESAILYYRNNRTATYPGQRLHHGQGFDLWGDAANGLRAGVNNWQSTVSSP